MPLGLITGIGGYNNKWKPLKENWGLYWYRSNPWLVYGLNKRIYENKYIDVDLHILGFNFLLIILIPTIYYAIKLSAIEEINQDKCGGIPEINDNYWYIVYFMSLFSSHIFQILDFEIKVFKYWSISMNFTVVVLYLLSYYTSQNKIDMSQNNNDM